MIDAVYQSDTDSFVSISFLLNIFQFKTELLCALLESLLIDRVLALNVPPPLCLLVPFCDLLNPIWVTYVCPVNKPEQKL